MKTATPSKERLVGQNSAAASSKPRIRNILVPIDFSQASLSAIQMTLPLVKRFGAALHLIHVFEPEYPLSSMAAIPLVVPELEIGKRVRRRLKHLADSNSVPLRRENIHAIRGRTFERICQLARKIEIDLIVMATRGNTGLKHLALGSTTERVVRYSPCPVLVVRGNGTKTMSGQQTATFGKILVPVDFSDCSLKGLAYSKKLAREFGAKLILVNSTALKYYVTLDEYARYDLPLLIRQVEEASCRRMSDLVQETDWKGIRVETCLRPGHAGEEICSEAASSKVDLIAISTHGRIGLKHVLLGSTAEYVVRHAPCPVLVIPSRERPLPDSSPNES